MGKQRPQILAYTILSVTTTTGNTSGASSLNPANDKHMKTTQVKVKDTRFPRMTRAILRKLNRESLKDVVNHGADGGFSGFIYYTETNAFFRAHKAEILALAESLASDLGEDMLTIISGFNCLKDAKFTPTEIGAAIFSAEGEHAEVIRNAMAWFALEEVARELNPEL